MQQFFFCINLFLKSIKYKMKEQNIVSSVSKPIDIIDSETATRGVL